MEEIKLKAKIDRNRKMVILSLDDPRARQGIKEEIPFETWFEFSNRITEKIAKSHRC